MMEAGAYKDMMDKKTCDFCSTMGIVGLVHIKKCTACSTDIAVSVL